MLTKNLTPKKKEKYYLTEVKDQLHSCHCFEFQIMEGEESPPGRQLATPERVRHHGYEDRRSRSRQRREASVRSSRSRRSRSRSRLCDPRSIREQARLRERERWLEQERERLQDLEDELDRRSARLRETVSRQQVRGDRDLVTYVTPSSRRRHPSLGDDDGPQRQRPCGQPTGDSDHHQGDRLNPPGNPGAFSAEDVAHLLNLIKNPQPQPSTLPALIPTANNHTNILPEFDPSSKNQRIDVWLKKVNECATVYGWNDRTTIHFSLQKLKGLAKTWYESLPTLLYSWAEWQDKLNNAFPYEQNYGQSLEDMLKRKSRFNEAIEVYYYEKLSLLNLCEIYGKKAADCIIHGLSDRTTKSSALALRCTNPEQLLQFLMSNKEMPQSYERLSYRNRHVVESSPLNSVPKAVSKPNMATNSQLFCFNCKEKGHPFMKCPKPLVKCAHCHKIGHSADNCMSKSNNKDSKTGTVHTTMCIASTKPNSKFYKLASVNGSTVKAFVDFGSEVTLVRQSDANTLKLTYDTASSALKGFGNRVIQSLGQTQIDLVVDDVHAQVICQVVADEFLEMPLLIGQSFTEQMHVVVYKNSKELKFLSIDREMPFSKSEVDNDDLIEVFADGDIRAYGPVSFRARMLTCSDGHVLLNSKVIGKPPQQFIVVGGIYEARSGTLKVSIVPESELCSLQKGMVIARAFEVSMVNRVTSGHTETTHKLIDENEINIGEAVGTKHRHMLLELLNRYKHCFASSLQELGCTDKTEMSIEVNSNRPIVYRPYRLSHKERENVREMVGEMLNAGIVRESVSEYASPIILVRKKDGKFRMCVDYRMLNSVTVKERYPMPNIDDEIARLSGQAYFVTLDLASGYYQVPISEKSRPLTSFVTPDGQYEFNRMPFGLANAPAIFQRMMNRVLGSARFSDAMAYIDDVLVYGRDIDECLNRLEKILNLLEDAKLTLNLSKCQFLRDQIDYLGYEISAKGVRPGTKKIQCVLEFPRPIDQHTVRQFLGLVGYFRKFIRNFAALAHPLTKLLAKDTSWTWTDEQEAAFSTLKEKLVDRPVLAIYNPSAITELHTDASKLGVGGVLLQRPADCDTFQPVAFYSRKTSPEEKNFHAYELETLAVVCSLKKYRVYLLGQQFKIVTDCSALRSTFSKRDIIPRVARWWLLLQEFQCTVEYRSGVRMAHVDALSRNPIEDSETCSSIDHYPSVLSISSEDWLQTLQFGDSELGRIRDILISNVDADRLQYIHDNYLIKDDRLYKYMNGDKTNIRWAVPKGARWQICRMNHDEIGHFGHEKTLERIKKSYWFPKMSRFVRKYVSACVECAYAKKTGNSKTGHLHPIDKVGIPFHTLHLDHLGPFVRSKRGNTQLLVIVDGFTKFVFAKPVRNTKTQSAIRVLDEIFQTFRNPDRIISDRGTCFTSHAFKRFCVDRGIRHVLNAVASPRANGQVERYNRTILNSLTAQNLNRDEKEWDDAIGKVQWGLNNTSQKTTGRTPAEIMFGSCMNSEINPKLNEIRQETREVGDLSEIREQVKDKVTAEQVKQKQRHDDGRRPARIYAEGDLVKITKISFNNDGKSRKLLPSYIGPYKVVAVLGNDRYRISAVPGLTNIKNKRQTTIAADRMLPWVHVAALELNDSVSTDQESENSGIE